MPWHICLIAKPRNFIRRLERALLQWNSSTICLQQNCYVPSICLVSWWNYCMVPFLLRRRTVVQLGFRLLWGRKSCERLYEDIKHHLQQWRAWSLACRGCFDNHKFLKHLIGNRRCSSSSRPKTTKRSWPRICDSGQTNRDRVDREMDRPILRNQLPRKTQESTYSVKLY